MLTTGALDTWEVAYGRTFGSDAANPEAAYAAYTLKAATSVTQKFDLIPMLRRWQRLRDRKKGRSALTSPLT